MAAPYESRAAARKELQRQDSNLDEALPDTATVEKARSEGIVRKSQEASTVRVQAETDAVRTALKAALEDAIAEGRSEDAAEVASELAARLGRKDVT